MAQERLITSPMLTDPGEFHTLITKHPEHSQAITFQAGQSIVAQGEISRRAVFILSGTAKYVVQDAEGTERLLAILKPGTIVAPAAALDGYPNQVSAEAVTNLRGLAISAASLRHLIKTDGDFALHFSLLLAQTNRLAVKYTADARFRKAGEQLRCLLHHLVREARAEEPPLILAVTQQELADLVGTSRNTISLELQALQNLGILRLGHGKIHVLQPGALACSNPVKYCVQAKKAPPPCR